MLARRFAFAFLILVTGVDTSAAPEPDPSALARGEFLWHPEIAPSGPVVVVVSLEEQRAYVYRNGVGIGLSTISSGRRGHETPPGVFSILQKQIVHFSNKYDDAPMPYMERLTWDGVAMHAGSLPGFPASHGCIRLPAAFARELYDVTATGVTVVVADRTSAPELVHPALLAPIDAKGTPIDPQRDVENWDDAELPTTPLTIVASLADNAVYVFRHGRRIAAATLAAPPGTKIGGSLLYVMREGTGERPSLLDATRPQHLWSVYAIATRNAPSPRADVVGSLHVSETFAKHLYDHLIPGTTVLVTDLPGTRVIDAKPARVLESNPAGAQP